MEISEHEYNEMMSALTSALATRQAVHKQHYLEQVLLRLVGPEVYDDTFDREQWERGLPE